MTTRVDPAPIFDPRRGRIAASEDQLVALATLAGGGAVEPSIQAELTAAGFLGLQGDLADGAGAIASTVATPEATITVRRLRLGSARRVLVRWSSHSVVATAPFEDPGHVGEVLVGAPTSLARTVWKLAQLGPRPLSTAAPIDVPSDQALAPFSGPLGGTWAADLGATAPTLVRVETAVEAAESATVVADLGDGGLWRLSDSTTWSPVTSTAVFGELAGLQGALVSGSAFVD